MKKIPLLVFSACFAILFQSCKKKSDTDSTTTSTALLTATINGSTWTPDTVSAFINYDPATKTKTFSCSGVISQKEVIFSVRQLNAPNGSGFPLQTFTADTAGNNKFSYLTQQKNSAGAYVFIPHGTVQPGSGSVTISAIDTVGKTITGSFNIISSQKNLDSNGNISSITIDNIAGGNFNLLPYKLASN